MNKLTFPEKPKEFSELKWRITKFFVKMYVLKGIFYGPTECVYNFRGDYLSNGNFSFSYDRWFQKLSWHDGTIHYTHLNLYYYSYFIRKPIVDKIT
jgi:hypothetical protein